MKTFKIVALQVLLDGKKATNIPLADGLIINQENEDGVWIVEAFIDRRYEASFEQKKRENKTFEIRVIITHAANDPAPFTAKVHTINKLGRHISVLFEGKLSHQRNEYLELLLDDLIKEGYSGNELVTEFKKRMNMKKTIVR